MLFIDIQHLIKIFIKRNLTKNASSPWYKMKNTKIK